MAVLLLVTFAFGPRAGWAQATETHARVGEFRPPTPADRFRQDPSRNNLVHPEGYRPASPNTLGRVERIGDGSIPLILVAGLGFGGGVFDPLLDGLKDKYRVYVVTLAGYGGTSAPPMPPAGTSYGERSWLAGAERGLGHLIGEEGLDRPVLAAFYSDAANAVTHFARAHPDQVRGLVLISASARFPVPPDGPSRAERLDSFADTWFRTVTEIMWPSGMFPPEYYANSRDVAELAWWEVLEPTLPTSIRYIVETWADDLVPIVAEVDAPVIVLSSDFAFLESSQREQAVARFHAGWEEAIELGGELEHRIVPGTRFLIWEDAPGVVEQAIEDLSSRHPR